MADRTKVVSALTKPVSTIWDFVHTLHTFCNIPLQEAGDLMFALAHDGTIELFNVADDESSKTTTYVVNTHVASRAFGLDGECRLIRCDENKRIPSLGAGGRLGSFHLPPMLAKAMDHNDSQRFIMHTGMLDIYRRIKDGMSREDDSKNVIWTRRRNRMELLLVTEFETHGPGPYHQIGTPEAAFRLHVLASTAGIASHQGSGWHRAVCDFALRYGAPKGSDEWDHGMYILEQEYNVNTSNYAKILEAGCSLDLFLNPAKYEHMLGTTDGAKLAEAVRAAFCIHELLTEGSTSYIFGKDRNSCGPADMSRMIGCRDLATATNMIYSGKEVNFAAEVLKFVGKKIAVTDSMLPYEDLILDPKATGKPCLQPIQYTASAASASRALVFRKGKGDDVHYLDAADMYIPGSLDKVAECDLNQKWLHVHKELGWEKSIALTIETASCIEEAFHMLSHGRARTAGQIMKKAVEVCNENKTYLTWPTVMGIDFVYRPTELDYSVLEKDDDGNIVKDERIKISGRVNGRRKQYKLYPTVTEARSSGALAAVLRVKDAEQNVLYNCEASDAGIPTANTHDKFGTALGCLGFVNEVITRNAKTGTDANFFNEIIDRYELPFNHFTPLRPEELDGKHMLDGTPPHLA